MNVLVAAVGHKDCSAARALLTEGVKCEVVAMQEDHDYADALGVMWRRGEGFCVVEHDVVPWPGAIGAICACHEPWCVYSYVAAPGAYMHALGCIRVSGELVREHPGLWLAWDGVPWNQLDAAVYRALGGVAGSPHFHSPPLAHTKFHDVLGEP